MNCICDDEEQEAMKFEGDGWFEVKIVMYSGACSSVAPILVVVNISK